MIVMDFEDFNYPRFSYGMNIGYHGSQEQRESVRRFVISLLADGDSVIIRGPFRVGKSTLLRELASDFDSRVYDMSGSGADYIQEWPKTGILFLDEAGWLPSSYWSTLSKEPKICAVLPDSISLPDSWKGRVVRLDAFLKNQDLTDLLSERESLCAKLNEAQKEVERLKRELKTASRRARMTDKQKLEADFLLDVETGKRITND